MKSNRSFFPSSLCSGLLSAFLVLASAASASLAQGYLHASSVSILDGNNDPFILRGIGLGGWLVPEGYMLGTNSPYDSPTGFRNAVESLIGPNTDQFFAAYRKSYVQRRDIDSIARWGFNSIRLPMHYGLLSSAPGLYLDAGFAIIDSLLSWCEADRLYLILDMHCAPGGQNSANISDYQGYPSLWEDTTRQRWTAELWKEIARRYADRHWIGGYDLLNETNWQFPAGNKPLRDLFVRITDSIRTADRNHLVFAEGNSYASDFSNLTPSWDGNMAWSFHKYWNSNTDPGSIQGYIDLRQNSNTPLWMGESGENSNQWFDEAVAMFESHHIGWSWWTLKKTQSIACPFSARRSTDYNVLLSYWNSGGPAPSAAFALAALTEEVGLLDVAQCTFHPDFIDALFRAPFTTARKPFAFNTIPGVVYPVNYDMGQNGYAYSDVDFENIGGTAYNSGNAYRNDGVDIEPCPDGLSNGFDVGWTAAGEFLAFTVQVQTGGLYHCTIRVSSGSSGGTAALSWDGSVLVSGFAVPGTGGWQQWVTIDLGNVLLDAGTHDLRLTMVSGGYNVDRMEFMLIAAGVAPPLQQAPRGFRLDQNFPNPCNPSTTIRYGLSRQSRVTLTVSNLLGEQLATLVNQVQEVGDHEVTFDGARLASGSYFYRLVAGEFSQTRRLLVIK